MEFEEADANDALHLNHRVASFSYYLLDTSAAARESQLLLRNANPPARHPLIKHNHHFSFSTCPPDNNSFVFQSTDSHAPAPKEAGEDPGLKNHDGELQVFPAHSYFNMNLDQLVQNKLTTLTITDRPHPPSTCSDTRSQLPLFPSAPALQTHRALGKQPSFWRRRRVFAGLGSCFNKKAAARIDNCALPRLSQTPPADNEVFPFHTTKDEETTFQQQPRNSLEVFGSKALVEKMETKLCMLSWDAIVPNQGGLLKQTISISDEIASDASSDLFEIENITGGGSLQPSSSELDSESNVPAATSPRPSTTNYPPSEASIQWSVVTASATDFSSEYNDEKITASATSNVDRRSFAAVKKGRNASGLLGCRNQKSVRVAEHMRRKSSSTN